MFILALLRLFCAFLITLFLLRSISYLTFSLAFIQYSAIEFFLLTFLSWSFPFLKYIPDSIPNKVLHFASISIGYMHLIRYELKYLTCWYRNIYVWSWRGSSYSEQKHQTPFLAIVLLICCLKWDCLLDYLDLKCLI